jgi:hypothetical protein
MRKMFNDLNAAKKEALFVAQRIQSGMQHVTDLCGRQCQRRMIRAI